ncbi:hypothetical protein N0V90_004775 [Kalmusia sp. IMI 367209]|nr:hypothetical protein N0V90_004775 [Kalmusia sp. IMI 367209]
MLDKVRGKDIYGRICSSERIDVGPIAYNAKCKSYLGGKCNYMCNGPEVFQVGLNNRQDDFPHMRLRMQFNGNTLECHFDCIGSQTPVWDSIEEPEGLRGCAGKFGDPNLGPTPNPTPIGPPSEPEVK